jgi:tRNA(His) guanylyltransferase
MSISQIDMSFFYSKIMTTIVSLFTAQYVYLWPQYFSSTSLLYAPSFDARVVLYPRDQTLRDYLSWRQADCHINNLYNTCFWALVNQGNMTPKEAEERLRDTLSGDKNELLFTQFQINYTTIDERYRKGSVLLWEKTPRSESSMRYHKRLLILHVDMIQDQFWKDHPDLLDD